MCAETTDNHVGLSLPRRRSARLQNYDYSLTGAYFVTICVHNRENRFGHIKDDMMLLNDAGKMLEKWWQKVPEKFPTELDLYVVMPNHFHAIILVVGTTPCGCPPSLPDLPSLRPDDFKRPPRANDEVVFRVMDWFKTMTTNEYIRGVKQHGWPRFDRHLWQSRYYDHVIRSERGLNAICEYINYNPARWVFDRENPACSVQSNHV